MFGDVSPRTQGSWGQLPQGPRGWTSDFPQGPYGQLPLGSKTVNGAWVFNNFVTFNKLATLNAAAGSNAVVFNGAVATYTVVVNGNSSSTQSYGVDIHAGTTAADVALSVLSQDATRQFLLIKGNSAFTFGNTTDNPTYLFNGVLKTPTSPLAATITQVCSGLAAYKASDSTSVNNTLTADAALTLTFNETGKYAIEIFLPFYEAAVATGGFQFDLGSGTATVGGIVFGTVGVTNAAFNNSTTTSTTAPVAAATVTTSATATSWFLAKGWVSITVAGTLAVRWAQNSTLGADPTTLKAGAYFLATKIG